MKGKSESDWPTTGVTGWLVRRSVPGASNGQDPCVRARLGVLQGWVNIVANLLIFLLKCVFGFILGSIALVADAFESLSDVGAGMLIVMGSRWSQKPPDARHPFGHGRAELVAALVTAILLIVVGVGLGKESLVRVLKPRAYVANWWVIGIIALTIPVKQWLATFSGSLSRATGSPLIEGGYWLLRFDALTTALVCFALISSRLGWVAVDGWVGLVVSIIIVLTGAQLVRDRISPLMGEAPSPEEVRAIEDTAVAVAGVRGVHDIIVHKYGDTHLVSLHIEVDARRPVMDIHDLSEQVESAVERASGCKAIAHVDPVDRMHPMYEAVENVLRDCVRNREEVTSFHDLRLTGGGDDLRVTVDVVLDVRVPEARHAEISRELTECVAGKLGAPGRVVVAVEASFQGREGS